MKYIFGITVLGMVVCALWGTFMLGMEYQQALPVAQGIPTSTYYLAIVGTSSEQFVFLPYGSLDNVMSAAYNAIGKPQAVDPTIYTFVNGLRRKSVFKVCQKLKGCVDIPWGKMVSFTAESFPVEITLPGLQYVLAGTGNATATLPDDDSLKQCVEKNRSIDNCDLTL